MPIVNKREFSELVGATVHQVNKWLAAGMPTHGGGGGKGRSILIDTADAIRWLGEKTARPKPSRTEQGPQYPKRGGKDLNPLRLLHEESVEHFLHWLFRPDLLRDMRSQLERQAGLPADKARDAVSHVFGLLALMYFSYISTNVFERTNYLPKGTSFDSLANTLMGCSLESGPPPVADIVVDFPDELLAKKNV